MTKENSSARRLEVAEEKHLDGLERYLLILKPVNYDFFKKNDYSSQIAIEMEKGRKGIIFEGQNKERGKYIFVQLINAKDELDIKFSSFDKYLAINKNPIQTIKDKFSNFLDTITGGYYTRS